MAKVLELKCSVQKYAWGKTGNSSLVAQLAKNAGHTEQIEESTPYAEFWMGAHPSGPSFVKTGDSRTTLAEWIKQHPDGLGENSQKKFGNNLPFLFKVLSVRTALSIQAHPDKSLAEELHKKFPDVYKDPNHKPEMAIALTEFKALCSFRPLKEILDFVDGIPELKNTIGAAYGSRTDPSVLKNCFKAMMTSPAERFKSELQKLVERLTKGKDANNVISEDLRRIFLQVHTDFPGDIGCFVVFFLNYVILKPGEALFLAANEPHAYLFGDCVECMACSDNVVRSGLTPKFKDVETLCTMLTYKSMLAKDTLYVPRSVAKRTLNFIPPVPDFGICKHDIQVTDKEYVLPPLNSASVMLVVKGSGSAEGISFTSGTVLYLNSKTVLLVKVQTDTLIFQAFCPL